MTAEPSRPAPAPWMLAVVDYLGPVAFIAGFFLMHRSLSAATWWLVGGSAAALVFSLAVLRRIALPPLIWGAAALVFGALTLLFHDTRILKMKTTAIDGALALFLLASLVVGRGRRGGGGALRLLLGEAVSLSDRGWRTLTLRYGLFFAAMAGLNELVWRTQSDTVWALFRMPGLLILAGLFALTQLPMMMREAREADPTEAAGALTELQE